MDAYRECLVARERSSKDRGIETSLLVVAVAGCLLAVLVTSLGFLLSAVCVLLWYLHMNFYRVEYEYLLMEGTVSVDIIYNQKRRKKLGEYTLKDVQALADSDDQRLDRIRKDGVKLLDYSSHSETGRTISLFLPDSQSRMSELRISPDETMTKLITQQVPMLARRLEMI